MPVKFPSIAFLMRLPWRNVAVGCVVLAGLGLAASLISMWPPVAQLLQSHGFRVTPKIEPVSLLQMLPILAAVLGLVGGLLCLAAASRAAGGSAAGTDERDASSATSAALAAVVQDLRAVLADERSRVAALQESSSVAMRDAKSLSIGATRLAEVALDAEKRLAAGVAKADEALRRPGSGGAVAAETIQIVERVLPEMADLINRRLAEQAKETAATVDAAITRLTAVEDNSVQTFRAAVADAVRHMVALGDTTIALHRDVIALDTAGREIATASATVVSRLGGTVAQVDAAVANLPAAAAAVTAGAELAVKALAEASDALRSEGASREGIANETRQAAEALQRETAALGVTKREIADAAHAAVATVARTAETAAAHLSTLIADADEARHGAANLLDLNASLEKSAATLIAGTASLDAAGQRVAAASEGAVGQLARDINETRQVTEALQREAATLGAAKQEIATAAHLAIAGVATAAEAAATNAAAVIADEARQRAASLEEITTTLGRVAAGLADGTANLDAAAQRAAAAGEGAVGQLVREIDETRQATEALRRQAATLEAGKQEIAAAAQAAISGVATAAEAAAAKVAATIADDARHGPARLEEVTGALERVAATLADETSNLDAAGQRVAAAGEGVAGQLARDINEARQVTEALQREAATLGAATREIEAAARAAISGVATAIETAASDVAASIADDARQGSAGLVQVTATLERAAASLVDSASSLDAAGQRVATAGEGVAGQWTMEIARGEAALSALPSVAADLAAAASDLRLETAVLAAAAQQVSSAANAASSAVTDVAVRAEVSAASLDTAGRMMSAAGSEVGSQIERLAQVARQADGQLSLVTDIATNVAAAAVRLQTMTDSLPAESMLTVLPELAANREAAASGLARLDALSGRLESAMAGLQADPKPDAAMMNLTSLSSEIADAVRRVELAMVSHESLAASMAAVEEAAAAVSEAAAGKPAADAAPTAATNSAARAGANRPFAVLAADSPPDALAATLSRLNDVSCQTETLLRQTEVLAEAVINGRAPGLPPLLADRTPVLLAGIEATTGRLRSVATALALVSDGLPRADRRIA